MIDSTPDPIQDHPNHEYQVHSDRPQTEATRTDPARPDRGQLNQGQPQGRPVPIVVFKDVELGYTKTPVLSAVNLWVDPGQFWCLLGQNGQGKTTLIKAILGTVQPGKGLLVRNLELFNDGLASYVPQRLELNPVLPTTLREFVLAGLAGVQSKAYQRKKRLDRVIEIVGLADAEKKNFWTLSGGQKQRALLARALIRNPRVLIVDEPTAGLDIAAAETIMSVLAEMHTSYEVTIIFVTHDLNIVTRHATHVALFREGTVLSGPITEVLTSQNLEETFGMSVPIEQQPDGRPRIRQQNQGNG